MSTKGSSKRWLQRQHNDLYVIEAQKNNYRSRALFKLQEIDKKYRVLRNARCVIDLGAAPGGWSQYVVNHSTAHVIACDILPMDPLAGVSCVQGDFTEENTFNMIVQHAAQHTIHVVLSDMAPNTSGNKSVDIPRAMFLSELALDTADRLLSSGGHCVIKAFHGEGFDALVKNMRPLFCQFRTFKPKASRKQSRETYLIGLHKR